VSERTSAEGNADAPRIEENEVRSGDGHLESGTRRAGEARRDQETDRQRRENESERAGPASSLAGSQH
jgi:hypothetical protein